MKNNSSSKKNDTTYKYMQFMFTLLPIKAVYLIHTQSKKAIQQVFTKLLSL